MLPLRTSSVSVRKDMHRCAEERSDPLGKRTASKSGCSPEPDARSVGTGPRCRGARRRARGRPRWACRCRCCWSPAPGRPGWRSAPARPPAAAPAGPRTRPPAQTRPPAPPRPQRSQGLCCRGRGRHRGRPRRAAPRRRPRARAAARRRSCPRCGRARPRVGRRWDPQRCLTERRRLRRRRRRRRLAGQARRRAAPHCGS